MSTSTEYESHRKLPEIDPVLAVKVKEYSVPGTKLAAESNFPSMEHVASLTPATRSLNPLVALDAHAELFDVTEALQDVTCVPALEVASFPE
tara:strand:- start:35050 stop:35325 length:276 start_codon:yes stop_codon:yes gene_type:complete